MNRTIAAISLAMAVLAAMPAKASITDALDGMYMATGNEPTIYSSQRRLGMDAGYLRLRAPVSTFQVFSFAPPQLDAGCGGIDLYGGSFSFINADEFRQMLRQIGANALGYAFKIAIATMCPICDSIMTGLQDTMNKLTALQVDTCKWGSGLAINTIEALGGEVEERYKIQATGDGSFTDTMQATRALFSDRGLARSDGDPSGADPNNLHVGNLTWNALTLTDAADTLAFPDANGLSNIELLLNIAGTVIHRAPDSTESEAGNVAAFWPAALPYEWLRTGVPQGTGADDDASPLWRCDPDAQRCLKKVPLAQWGLDEGLHGWVRGRLEQAAAHMSDPATAGTDHDADMQVFLGSLPWSIVRHFQALQGNAAGLQQYVTLMTPYITSFYAPHVALSLARVVEQAYTHPEAPSMHQDVRWTLERFKDAAHSDLRSVQQEYGEVTFQAERLVAIHSKREDPGAVTRPR